MRRTALVAAPAALVILWNWLRLEEAPRRGGEALVVVALALLPALAPGRARRGLAAAGATLLAVPAIALDAPLDRHLRFVSAAAHRFDRGFGRFFDVVLPFAHAENEMHGVVLVAIFGFTFATGLAVAARKPALAVLALVAGAGWPASLLAGGGIARGAAILGAALCVFAGLRGGRGHARPLAAGALVLVGAVAASSFSSVARGGLVDWQHWRPGGAGDPTVSVRYVWSSDYSGLRWPKKKTEVLKVEGPPRPLYWRATTLDVYDDRGWYETDDRLVAPEADPLLPRRSEAEDRVHLRVRVLALDDSHLPAPASPVSYAVDVPVSYTRGGVAHVLAPMPESSYSVTSYAPSPTPAQLAASGRGYPPDALPYLQVPGGATPPFGAAGRAGKVDALLRRTPVYRALYAAAARVVGDSKSPYGAAVALESWLRTDGGFAYDELPPRSRGLPPIVDFVTRTKTGYCQHFAGAMALMLRYLGVPARVAVGFTSGEYDPTKHEWTVTDHDAHAWVEVWFPRWGWLPFDPTPGRGTLDGSYTSSSASFDTRGAADVVGRSSPLQNALAQRARANPRLEGELPVPSAGGALADRGCSRGTVLAALLFVAGGALVAVAATKRAVRRTRLARAKDPRALAAACRRELVVFAADQGVALPPAATLAELVALLAREFGADARRFAATATEAAYASPESSAAAALRLRRELDALLRAVGSSVSLLRRVRGALALRTL